MENEKVKIGRENKTLIAQIKQLQISMNTNEGRDQEKPSELSSNAVDEYEIESLLDDEVMRGKHKYLVFGTQSEKCKNDISVSSVILFHNKSQLF